MLWCGPGGGVTQADGFISSSLNVTKGVPHGSVLGPLIFTIYINNIDQNVNNTHFHYYADDTVMYSSASTPDSFTVTA